MRKMLFVLCLAALPIHAIAQNTDAAGSSTPSGTPAPTPTPASGGVDWASLKAAYDAMAAAATSQKALIDARNAVALARIGTVTGQTEIKGTVTLGSYTPKGEALLLLNRSTQMVAGDIATNLAPSLGAAPYSGQPVLVLTGTNELATGDAVLFDLQLHGVALMLRQAVNRYNIVVSSDKIKAKPPAGSDAGGTRMAPLMAAGAVIDGLAKLGSYFQSDYTFGSVDVDPAPGMVANALIDAIRRKNLGNQLVIPSNLIASDATVLTSVLQPVEADYLLAVGAEAAAKERADELHKIDAKGAGQLAAQYTDAATEAAKAIAAYDTFFATLTAAPADGKEAFIVRIIRQKAIQAQLAAHPLILLLSSRPAAQYYTKRNLWTFLGGPPLYTMGGISLTYTLYKSDTGAVLIGGTAAKHGGYRSVRDVEKLFR